MGSRKILITGVAGFIGFHLAKRLLEIDEGIRVIGIDNLNDYYDRNLKLGRLQALGVPYGESPEGAVLQSGIYKNFSFLQLDITHAASIMELFRTHRFDYACHLAAQAGVRYSIDQPYRYTDANITGFLSMLEACRHFPVRHLVYASSSSVYGSNDRVPFSEDDRTDAPVSLYAASKKSNELMAHAYCKLYRIPVTGLRFFTVYGPWGRPDMAPFLFTDAIAHNRPIEIFNNGEMWRDFTYIDDITSAVTKILYHLPKGSELPYALYNIGCSTPVKLMDFISRLEIELGKSAEKIFLPMQPGDVVKTYADTTRLQNAIGYSPDTSLAEGLRKFVHWYREFYGIG